METMLRLEPPMLPWLTLGLSSPLDSTQYARYRSHTLEPRLLCMFGAQVGLSIRAREQFGHGCATTIPVRLWTKDRCSGSRAGLDSTL